MKSVYLVFLLALLIVTVTSRRVMSRYFRSRDVLRSRTHNVRDSKRLEDPAGFLTDCDDNCFQKCWRESDRKKENLEDCNKACGC
ncbi:hypothetical protein ABFA07_002434 [Porites harrisoni]